jgi:hypothetical protein
LVTLPPLDQAGSFGPIDDIDGRHRQENLLADHLAKAGRRPADPHIGNFSERIALDVG